jgi:hypothetical protein
LAPKQKNVDFSIITPVYNGEKWISETIRSVLKNCKGFDFEYISFPEKQARKHKPKK